MIIEIVGWIGLALLLFGYAHFAVKNNLFLFFMLNSIASIILTLYAFFSDDPVFTIVNGFIAAVLLSKAKKQMVKEK